MYNKRGVLLYGGSCHKEIQQTTNIFNDIISLHLADINGLPMHALENGFYFYAEGLGIDGTCSYYKNEEEREKHNKIREVQVYQEFLRLADLQDTDFVKESFAALRMYYRNKDSESHKYASLKWQADQNIPFKNKLVVSRNNQALASHLRIPIEVAKNIPAGLTKEEFNQNYILPNIERWKNEAQTVIQKYNLKITKE